MWNRRVDITNNLNKHDKNKNPTRFRSKILTLKTLILDSLTNFLKMRSLQ